MRPDLDDIGPVPFYPGEPVPPADLTLSVADRRVLAAMGYDTLCAALRALLDEALRLKRCEEVSLVPTMAVLRINGLLDLARAMTAGSCHAVPIESLPETAVLSPFELAGPLQAAVTGLVGLELHRPRPFNGAWRGMLPPLAAAGIDTRFRQPADGQPVRRHRADAPGAGRSHRPASRPHAGRRAAGHHPRRPHRPARVSPRG